MVIITNKWWFNLSIFNENKIGTVIQEDDNSFNNAKDSSIGKFILRIFVYDHHILFMIKGYYLG